MAIVTVTVYKKKGVYYPNGCEASLTCGKFQVLNNNVTLEMPSANGPLHCEDELPPNVTATLIMLENGDRWWVQASDNIIGQCQAQVSDSPTFEFDPVPVDGEGPLPLQDRLLVAIGVKPVGGNQAVSIGTTPGGNDLVNNENTVDGVEAIFNVGYKPPSIPANLYISGLLFPTSVKFYYI